MRAMGRMKGSFRGWASFPLNYRMQSVVLSVWFAAACFRGRNDFMIAIANTLPVVPKAGRALRFLMPLIFALMAASVHAALPGSPEEVTEAEKAVVKMASKLEKEGFDFRADIWERELPPELGKAVRVQFFKGNDYRVCVAVGPESAVQIAAHVLDMEGQPVESKVEATPGGWGVVLHVTPKRTGVFVVVVRRSGGAEKTTSCAMITGYK
jgi:hypothetical protein